MTLKNLAELSKTVQPVVAQLQSMTQSADRVLKAGVDPRQGPLDRGQRPDAVSEEQFGGRSRGPASCRQFGDNSFDVSERRHIREGARRKRSNVDVTLKNLAELSKTVQPVVAQLQRHDAGRRPYR